MTGRPHPPTVRAKSFMLAYHSFGRSGAVISQPPHTFREQMEIPRNSRRVGGVPDPRQHAGVDEVVHEARS